jgi:hypothetical protein
MRLALVLLTGSLCGCRYDLDHRNVDAGDANARLCQVSANVQSCLDSASHSDLTYLQAEIFAPKCSFTACHDGGNYPAGRLDMRTLASAYTSLVNMPSKLDSSRTIVVPGNSTQSFLSVMIGEIKPADADPPLDAIPMGTTGLFVGTMPQDSTTVLCCQKLDAIARWIDDGAANM